MVPEGASRVGRTYRVEVAHATHTTHAAHAAHSRHPHTAHIEVLVKRGLVPVLLVLVDPLGEVGLDERVPDLVLCQTGPVLRLELLLAEEELQRARRELL